MARPLRWEFRGAIYHLTGRGNARPKIFFVDANRGMVQAYKNRGYRPHDIAAHLGAHYVMVSRHLSGPGSKAEMRDCKT